MFGFDRISNEPCRLETVLLSEHTPQGNMLSAPFSSGEGQVLGVVFPRTSGNHVVQDWSAHTLYLV
jgi:hypothetical protein